MIFIEYDGSIVEKNEIQALSESVQQVVLTAKQLRDVDNVFVYANSSEIKVNISPIEILVKVTDNKILDEDKLIEEIKNKLSEWKNETNFKHKINLTVIPMNWKVEIGI